MRKTIPMILALAAAMAMGSAFAEQKGQGKGDRPDKAQGVTPKGGDKGDKADGKAPPSKVVTPRDPASGQATGKRQHGPIQ